MVQQKKYTLEITSGEVDALNTIPLRRFDTYVPSLLNKINAWAKATNKENVGHLNELIIIHGNSGYAKWRRYYLKSHKKKLDRAVTLIAQKLKNVKKALNSIDENTMTAYVEDLVLAKTYRGFRIQQLIFKEIKKQYHVRFKPATTKDESKGIDGYLNDEPVSVKPVSYKKQTQLQESHDIPIVYYKFTAQHIEVDLLSIKRILNSKKSH